LALSSADRRKYAQAYRRSFGAYVSVDELVKLSLMSPAGREWALECLSETGFSCLEDCEAGQAGERSVA
jgi:hypothetical protein